MHVAGKLLVRMEYEVGVQRDVERRLCHDRVECGGEEECATVPRANPSRQSQPIPRTRQLALGHALVYLLLHGGCGGVLPEQEHSAFGL